MIENQKEIKELKRYVLLANNELVDTQRNFYKPHLYFVGDIPFLACYIKDCSPYTDEVWGEELCWYGDISERNGVYEYKIVDTSDDPKDLIRDGDYVTLKGENAVRVHQVCKNDLSGLFIFDIHDFIEYLRNLEIQTIYKWVDKCLVPVWSCDEKTWIYQDGNK